MIEKLTEKVIEEKVIAILKNYVKSFSEISSNTLLADLQVDSITFIKIVVALEEGFDMEFDDEKLLITTFPIVKDFVDYLSEVKCNLYV